MGWNRKTVAGRIGEACDTLRRVPAQELRSFRSSWPEMIGDIIDGYDSCDAVIRLAPASPKAVDRMHEVFSWFVYLTDRPQLTKAMWLTCGRGMGPKRAAVIIGAHRDTVRRRRDEALELIVTGLNEGSNRKAA